MRGTYLEQQQLYHGIACMYGALDKKVFLFNICKKNGKKEKVKTIVMDSVASAS